MTIIFLHNLSDFAMIFSQKHHFAKHFALACGAAETTHFSAS